MTLAEEFFNLSNRPECSLYELSGDRAVSRYLVSTPYTRAIFNDPFILGCDYTSRLERACAVILNSLKEHTGIFASVSEEDAVVLKILRGGLNFGIRNALAAAFSWNRHAAAFISAQRARDAQDPASWYIQESDYQKVYLPKRPVIVFGDVVATGTSLEHALSRLLTMISEQSSELQALVFFTIGGNRAEQILERMVNICRETVGYSPRATVVYLEGRFEVADADTPLQIKIDGTDLLRRGGLITPEFIESQYEQPSYPLERCTIYDAGSRAFWVPEYLADIEEYWKEVRALAQAGQSYEAFLQERMPQLDVTRFGKVDLESLAELQLAKIPG